MCTRYALMLSPALLKAQFGYAETPNFPPRYNIAPTQPIAIVMDQHGERHFMLVRWGFLPGWVKDPKDFPLIVNARSETAVDKPAFRNAMRRRRCVVPADGWYEWRRHGRQSTPFLIRRRDRAAMAFAGLWETWSSPDGSEIDTAAILTTSANGMLSAIHDRMPAMLAGGDVDRWLDVDHESAEAVAAMLKPAADDLFEIVAIGPRIGNPRHEGADLQDAAPATPVPAVGQPAPDAGLGDRKRRSRQDAGGQGSLF